MIEIQVGVPIPTERKMPTMRVSKYPWHAMEIGDSFFVANFTTKGFAGTVYSAGKRSGKKFTVRAMDGGVRVWRIE
jgi:hypothetical protein